MTSEKIALVLDTNILERGKNFTDDFSYFSLESYEEALSMIEINDLIENVNIYIPEIVLLELSSHKLDRINNRLKDLKQISLEFKNITDVNISGHDIFDVDRHIEKLKKSTLNDINYIEIPEDWSNLFNRVLQMALYKIPPFEKGRGKSDKGFKDAIVLLSMVKFAKNCEFTKFVLFSQDQAFKKNEDLLKDFFQNETTKELEIQATADIQGYISNKFGLFIDLKKFLNDYFSQIDDEIKEKEKIYIENEDVVCDISNFEIDNENTVIKQVNEYEYDILVAFKLSCVCKDDDKREITDLNRLYTIINKDSDWLIEEKNFNYKVF